MATAIPIDENGNPTTAAPAPEAPTPPTSIVAPNSANAPMRAIPVDETGQPIAASHDYQNTNLDAATHLLERGFLRSNPFLAIPNQVFVGGQLGGDWLARKTGYKSSDEPYTPINPLESLIHGLGADIDPDAGPTMQVADAVAPWLRLSPSQGGRVGEAGGAWNKIMTAGRSEVGNLTDWALSDEAQQWAKDYGMGPLAQMLAGFAGGTVRTPVTRAMTPFVRKVIPGKEGAGKKVEMSENLDPAPTPQPAGWTGVETPPGSGYDSTPLPTFRDVADPTSSVARFISGAGFIPFSGTGEAGATKAQTAAITRTANSALQQLDPGTTPVEQAGPQSANLEGASLRNRAQQEVLDNENQLMARSDAIDNAIGVGAKTEAAPLRAAATAIINGDNASIIKNQAQKFLDNIDRQTDANGNISYGVLKGERSAFNQYLSSQETPAAGEPTIKNTLVRALDPLKDALTERMSATAHAVSPELGAAFDQNDNSWKVQSARKENLESLTGDLNPTRSGFVGSPGGKQVAKDISKTVAGEGKKAETLTNLETGFNDDQPVRSAVAETIATRGRPQDAKDTQEFRPSTFGEGVQSRVDPEILNWIEQKAGPEARRKLETAAEAGAGTSAPREQSGLSTAIGKIVGAAPYVGASGAAFGPAGLALTPLAALLTSISHDPDLIRTVANKNVPFANFIPQLLTHGALGSEPNAIAPAEAFKYGVGQASNAIRSGVGTAVSTVPEILKFLSTPKLPDKLKALDQRR